MSEAVDTRIVEAKFDSAQFEKGVDRTVKKLDELKKSLNLDEAGKSIAQLADKTQEATNKASNALQQLEDRFTSFAGMLKQKLLSGIADEIVGMFFKIKNGFEGLVKSLTSSQISTGMSKYEQMLTSVRTMIAAGDSEDAAYAAIETLGAYADQTSYSLDQMTSALSKMRAAGVDLETGTKAVEGISNACAAAGVNATDASRAFFNLSQAYSSGYLKYTDYRSLELLNMTTEKFKIQMLDAATAAGTLKKISDGVYQTVNTNDKKVSAGKKITIKNLSDALKYNFMNTEAMNKLFGEGFFFDEKEWKKIRAEFKAAGKSEEEALQEAKTRFGDVAVNAYFAAREARSFTDVMNTFKDVISRGWSSSFEIIFGRLEEAKKFFTDLTESNFAQAIYNISEFRNQVLQHWADSGGRDDLITALHNIDDLLGRILGHFTIFSDSEGDKFTNTTRNIGHRLSKASFEFRKFTERLDAWFTEARIAKIQKAIRTIGNVLSTVFRALGIVFNFATKMFVTFMPILSKIIDNVDKVITRINNIFNAGKKNSKTKDGLDSLSSGLNNIVTAVEPLIGPLGQVIDFLGDVASFLVEIAAGSFIANLDFLSETLGFIIELFGGKSDQQNSGISFLDRLKDAVIKLGDGCKESLQFVTNFFGALYEDILVALGIHDRPEGEEGGFFANVQKFFDTSEFLANIKQWFDELPDKINRIIYGNKKYRNKKENGKVVGLEHYYEGGIINVLKSAFENVQTWITTELPTELDNIWEAINRIIYGNKKYRNKKENGKVVGLEHYYEGGIMNAIKAPFESVKTWITTELPKEITNIWNTVDEFIFGKKVAIATESAGDTGETDVHTTRVKEGFSAWLSNLFTSVKDWFKNGAFWNTIVDIWTAIDEFLFGTKVTVATESAGDIGETDVHTTRVKSGFSAWIANLFTSVKDWFKKDFWNTIVNIWSKIDEFLFGTKVMVATESAGDTGETDVHTERVKEGFSAWLANLFTSVKDWFENGGFWNTIVNIWKIVDEFLFGKKITVATESAGDVGGTDVHTDRVKEGFSAWLDNIVQNVSGWFDGFHDKIASLWSIVLDAIFGTGEDSPETPNTDKEEKTVLGSAEELVADLGRKIGKILSNLPAHIVEGWNFTLGLTDTFFSKLTEYLSNRNDEKEAGDAASESIENIISGATEAVKDESSESSPLLSAILTFGFNLKQFITSTIPAFITEAFEFIKDLDLIGVVTTIFDIPNDWPATLQTKAEEIGTKVAEAIRSIPGYIRTAAEGIKYVLTYDPELERIKKDIRDSYTDEFGNIINPKEMNASLEAAEKEYYSVPRESGLWKAIKEIFGATGDVIKELGPDILNAINEVLIWLGKQLTKVTDIFADKKADESIGEAVARHMGTDEDAGKEPSALTRALTNVGETIKNLIVTIIPNFIKSGINVLSQEVPKLLGGLFDGSIFEGASSSAQASGEAFIEAMQDNLPNVENKSKTYTRNEWVNLLEQKQAELTDYLEYADKESEEYKNAEQLLAKVQNHISSLKLLPNVDSFDPVLYGFTQEELILKKRIKVKDKLDKLIEEINKSSSSHGGLLYGTITESERKMYDERAKLEQMLAEGKEWYYEDNLVTANETIVEDLESTNDVFKTLLNFATSDATKTIGIIAAIGWVLHELKDMLSLSDEMEAPGYSMKWTGITIAIGGVVTILGVITYLAMQADKTKFERVEKIFTNIGSFIERILELVVWITGLMAGKEFFSMVSTINSSAAENNSLGLKHPLLSSLLGTVVSTLETFGLVSVGSDVITSSIENVFGGILEAVQQIGAAIESIMVYIEPGIKRMAALNTDITIAIESFNKFKSLLEDFKSLVLGDGGLFGVIGTTGGEQNNAYLQQLYDFQKDVLDVSNENNITPPGSLSDRASDDSLVKSLETRLAWLYNVTSLVYEIGNALSAFEKVDNPTKVLEEITDLFSDKNGSFRSFLETFFATMTPNIVDFTNGILPEDKIESAGSILRLFGSSLDIFTGAISGLSMDQVTVLDKGLDIINRLADMLNDGVGATKTKIEQWFGGDNSIGSFGRAILTFGGNMEAFFGHVKNINTDSKSAGLLRDNLQLVLMTVHSMANSTKMIGSGKIDSLNKTFEGIGGLGTKIMQFLNEIAGFETVEGFDIGKVSSMLESVGILVDLLNPNKFGTLSNHVDNGTNYDLKRIEILKTALLGENNDGGFLGLLFDIHESLRNIKSAENLGESFDYNFDETVSALKVFSLLVTSINEIIANTEIPEAQDETPFRSIIEALSAFNFDFSTINTFIENAKELDQNGIVKAVDLFGSIRDLAEAIHYFGEESFDTGIDNLNAFDFGSFLQIIKDTFNPDDFKAIGKAAGENLDAGLAAGINGGEQAIKAAQALCDAISGTFTVSWQMRSPSKLMEMYGRFLNEGLANGIADDGQPTEAAREMAQDVINEAQSILNDPKSSMEDKSYARSILDKMFGIGDYKFGQELKKEYTDVVEDTVQTINGVTDSEWNKLKNPESFFDVLMKSAKSVWNTTFGREDNTTVLKSLLYHVPENPEVFVDTQSKILNFAVNGMVWLGDKLEEASREYIPNLATLFLDSGLLSGDETSASKVFAAIEAMTDDVSLYTDNLWVKFAGDLAGAYKTAFAHLPEDEKASGWEIAKTLFSNVSSTIGEYAREHGGIFSEAFSYVKDLDIGKIFGGVETAVPAFMDYLSSLGTKLGQPVVNFASDTMSSIYEALLTESDGEDGSTVVSKLLNNLISTFSAYADNEGLSGEVASKMLEIFNIADAITENGADLTPKITPILEISDNFRNTANQIGQLLGFNELLQVGENGTLTVNNTSMGLAEQLAAIKGTDYSALMQEILTGVGSLQQGIDSVGVRLGSMKFIINGKEFAYTIGPDINEYLGYEDATRGGRYATWAQEMES